MQPAPVLRWASSAALPRPDPTSINTSLEVTPAWSTASRTAATGQGRYGTQPRGRSGSSSGISSMSHKRSSHKSRSRGAISASAAQKVPGVTRPPRSSDRRRAAASGSVGSTPIFVARHQADDGSGHGWTSVRALDRATELNLSPVRPTTAFSLCGFKESTLNGLMLVPMSVQQLLASNGEAPRGRGDGTPRQLLHRPFPNYAVRRLELDGEHAHVFQRLCRQPLHDVWIQPPVLALHVVNRVKRNPYGPSDH